MKKILDYLTRTHLYWDVIVFNIVAILLLIRWQELATYQRLTYGLMLTMCLHQIEEYRIPGGFLWGLNDFMGSNDQLRYPGNRLSASFVDILSFTLAVPPLIFKNCTPVLTVIFALFGCIECCVHFAAGVSAYKKYQSKGKDTLYFPGSATAFFGFLPLAITAFYELNQVSLLSSDTWIRAISILVLYFIFFFLLPTLLLIDKNSPYIYTCKPVRGYFEKYTN